MVSDEEIRRLERANARFHYELTPLLRVQYELLLDYLDVEGDMGGGREVGAGAFGKAFKVTWPLARPTLPLASGERPPRETIIVKVLPDPTEENAAAAAAATSDPRLAMMRGMGFDPAKAVISELQISTMVNHEFLVRTHLALGPIVEDPAAGHRSVVRRMLDRLSVAMSGRPRRERLRRIPGDPPGGFRMFLEYLAGGSLDEYEAAHGGGGIHVVQMRVWLRQLLTGLSYLHYHGIAHRDLSGANILFDKHGRGRLIDFGISSLYKRPPDHSWPPKDSYPYRRHGAPDDEDNSSESSYYSAEDWNEPRPRPPPPLLAADHKRLAAERQELAREGRAGLDFAGLAQNEKTDRTQTRGRPLSQGLAAMSADLFTLSQLLNSHPVVGTNERLTAGLKEVSRAVAAFKYDEATADRDVGRAILNRLLTHDWFTVMDLTESYYKYH